MSIALIRKARAEFKFVSHLPAVDEGHRQRYLATLGIPLWTSRHDLPGARLAAPLEFVAFVQTASAQACESAAPILEATAAFVTVPDVSAQTPSRIPVLLPASVQSSPDSRSSDRDAVAAALKSPVPDANFPRFSCHVQPLAQGWTGVIALDDAAGLSAQEHRLLDNLIHALGGDSAMPGAREDFFWPISPNPSIARDAGAAREALAGFLGRRREHAHYLVLGETLAVYVRAALPQQTVIAAPSLRELLESPSAKRALWQALHA